MIWWRARKKLKRPSLHAGFLAGTLAVCLALVGLAGWRTWQARDVVLASDEAATANLARSLAQQAHDLVQAADIVLLGLAEPVAAEHLHPDAIARLNRQLASQAAALPAIKHFAVLDAEGVWIASSDPEALGHITSNTDAAFAYHSTHATSVLLVGEPVRSQIDGAWVLNLSRRVNLPDGRFGGVVLATVSVDYINALYATFAAGEGGNISLTSTTGRIIARNPFREDAIGADVSHGQIFHDFLPHAPEGSFRFRSTLDGDERLGSYQHVQSYPLLVVVAHGYDAVLADWWKAARLHIAITGAIAIILVFAAIRFAGQIRSRQKAEHHYRLLADYSIDAIVSLSLGGERLYVSPAFEALTGWSATESAGPEWTRIVHPHDHARLRQVLRKFQEGAANFTTEFRYICKSGRYLWVEAHHNLAPAANGADAQIVVNIRDITERKASEIRLAALNQRLAAQANTDQLTNLANRRRFDEALEQEWQRSAREQTPLSLLLLDVDRFKLYNDRYGHQAGDRCLAAVAAALRACGRRPGDLVARYGGEEFAILLPGTPVEGATQRAEAIRAAVQALAREHGGNAPAGVVTASLGAATCYPRADNRALTAEKVIQMADEGLYAAKRTGRNKVVHYGDIPQAAPEPVDEAQRLATVAQIEAVVAAGTRDTLDRLARLTAALFQTPIALVTLVGQDSQCFAGRTGLDIGGTSRDVSFCAHVIANGEILTVPDACDDGRFAENPLVTGEPGIRFYAGAPLIAPNGDRLGALCIIDQVPRMPLTAAQKTLLANLAALAVDHLWERSQAQA